jgi:hypothetical protein
MYKKYKKWIGLNSVMVDHSSQRAKDQMLPRATPQLFNSLAIEYRKLQDLRERVRKAEVAAAKRQGPRTPAQNNEQ